MKKLETFKQHLRPGMVYRRADLVLLKRRGVHEMVVAFTFIEKLAAALFEIGLLNLVAGTKSWIDLNASQ